MCITMASTVATVRWILLNRLADCLFYLLVRSHLDVTHGVFAAFAHPQLSAAMELMH